MGLEGVTCKCQSQYNTVGGEGLGLLELEAVDKIGQIEPLERSSGVGGTVTFSGWILVK